MVDRSLGDINCLVMKASECDNRPLHSSSIPAPLQLHCSSIASLSEEEHIQVSSSFTAIILIKICHGNRSNYNFDYLFIRGDHVTHESVIKETVLLGMQFTIMNVP